MEVIDVLYGRFVDGICINNGSSSGIFCSNGGVWVVEWRFWLIMGSVINDGMLIKFVDELFIVFVCFDWNVFIN